MRRNTWAACIALTALALMPAAASAEWRPATLASAGPTGGNGPFPVQPYFGNLTGGGFRVFFVTSESLVAGDLDQAQDVYEATADGVTLISTGPQGGSGSIGASAHGSSLDGSRAYLGTAEALTADDTDSVVDIYERSGETTTLLSPLPVCDVCSMGFARASEDGQHVFYEDGMRATRVWERFRDENRLVSTGPTASPGTIFDEAHFLGSSADGSRVFFQSLDRLVADDTDRCFGGPDGSCGDVYERSSGETHLVSTGPAASNGTHHIGYQEPFAASKDGAHAFFMTTERLVSEDDTSGSLDVYERLGQATRLISTGPAATDSLSVAFLGQRGTNTVSEDGSRVFFVTDERLVAEDVDGTANIYGRRDVYLRSRGVTTLISTGPRDAGTGGESFFEWATPNGSHVVFGTHARLTAEDTDTAYDIYEWSGRSTRLVSIGPAGGNASCEALPSECWPGSLGITRDGRRVFFWTRESLVAADTDSELDVYERSAGQTQLVTRGTIGGNGPFAASGISVSRDGRRLHFTSAERLSPADADTEADIYATRLNARPRCADAVADPAQLRPANHKFRTINVAVADPDGDPVSVEITGITQDEPVAGRRHGRTSPDALTGATQGQVRLRAERSADGDGRVYRVSFEATDSLGESCAGLAKVGVPKGGRRPRDSAPPSYDSFAS